MKSNFVYNKSNFIIKLFYIKRIILFIILSKICFSCFPYRGLYSALSYM